MNIKLTNGLLGLVAFFTASQINAATILVPSDGDVNFLVSQPFIETFDYTLAVFDEAAIASINIDNEITDISSLIDVTLTGPFQGINGPTYQGLLGLSDNFIVGLSTDDGTTWLADAGATFGVNTSLLNFDVPGTGKNEVFVVDVNPVPVPAAVWLFGSGLIGLAGIARRKKV